MNEKKKEKSSKSQAIRAVILIAVLLAIVNMNRLPFLSAAQKAAVTAFMNAHFSQIGSTFSNVHLDMGTLLSLIVMVICIYVVEQIILLLLGCFGGKTGRKATIRKLLNSIVRYAAVLIGIIWGLAIMGVNVAAIFAGVGIVGIIVGFGAQSLVEDIITGLFIIFEGQYSVGDIVCIDGFRGTVSAIGVRTTHIVDLGGNIKIINNSDIRNIQNLSSRTSIAIADMSIAYDESIERVEQVIGEVLPQIKEQHRDVFPNVPVYLGVQELGDSAVVLRVTATVDEPDIYRARRILNRELKLAFDRNHVEIPFPQIVVHKGEQ